MQDPIKDVNTLEVTVAELTRKLADAKAAVQEWNDATSSLARSAAEARAKNQGAGTGFLGGLLGAKFRGAMRSAASASNAAIAKDVASKRASIARGKLQAQELVRQIQADLAVAKQELKSMTVGAKGKAQAKVVKVKAAAESINLLQKLKEARDLGLLTDDEYDQKRKKLIDEI